MVATNCRNMNVDLLQVPDYALDWFIEWHNEASKEPPPFDPTMLGNEL
jgi:hypothetical protein